MAGEQCFLFAGDGLDLLLQYTAACTVICLCQTLSGIIDRQLPYLPVQFIKRRDCGTHFGLPLLCDMFGAQLALVVF